jgi:deoxyribonuclease-4
MLLIGSNVSYNKETGLLGCLDETRKNNGNSFMFYIGSPQNTIRNEIDDFLTYEAIAKMKKNNISLNNIYVHAPYILNFANKRDIKKYNFYVKFLYEECKRCEKLFVKYIILHPGNYLKSSSKEAIINISNALNIILENTDTTILLETLAGKGTEVGKTFEELNEIISLVKYKDKIGICLDTCHIHDAGYDISNFDDILDNLEDLDILKKVKCIHLNDSKNERGTSKDRHANIGFGKIGFDNLLNITYNERVKQVPKILETPYIDNKSPYKKEILMLKAKKFNSNLMNEV